MPVFKYKAINANRKTIFGLVEAPDQASAANILKEKKLNVILLNKKSGSKNIEFELPFLNRIKPKDVVIFSRQFSVLISAGVTLVQSLRLLCEQTSNIKLRKIVLEIAEEVDGGARLSNSLAKRPKVFSPFYINVIKSGETSGKLDEVLNYLADELEKDYDMNSKIKGAMIYPAFVLSALGGVGIAMMIFVVPKLTDMIQETGGELPMATKILIAISGFMANFWWLLAFILVALIVGFRLFIKMPIGKQIVDKVLLDLPIFGKLYQKIYLVRFARSLQILLVGGVNITKGLQICSAVVNNYVYKKLILETKSNVEDGSSISSVFAESNKIPIMVSQMMSIGEETGKLDVILNRITDFYTREINNSVANLMTLMEPIIMVVLGAAVGMMVAAIIMPMYNMAV
ncbi:MAG: type II secretion system F family protein [Patescibacteria group bacterium]|nr:type II secretion system F family protein [Patescibacteria group bacterium]